MGPGLLLQSLPLWVEIEQHLPIVSCKAIALLPEDTFPVQCLVLQFLFGEPSSNAENIDSP